MSLSYLHQFPFDTLKLDRSFLRNTSDGRENFEIVKAAVQLAHALRIKVLAEGVEPASDAGQVARMGCEFGQGYHFCRPLDCGTGAGVPGTSLGCRCLGRLSCAVLKRADWPVH